jgi:hypothetical protein
VVVGNAVDGGGGDVDNAFDAGRFRGGEDVPRAVDLGGEDVFLRIEREGGGGVDDPAHPLHGAGDVAGVANVALEEVHAVFLRIVEGGDVEGAHRRAAREEMAHHVDAEEAAASGDQCEIGHE